MAKWSNLNKTDILHEFQKYLSEMNLVPQKNVSFYALWANKYFAYARKKQIVL